MADMPFLSPDVEKKLEQPNATAPHQTDTEVWIKRGAAVLVGVAGIADQLLPEDSPWKQLVGIVFAVGAAFGITSRGNLPRR